MENVLDDLAFEAGRYIKRRAAVDRPFFLYMALTAPHKPVLPHPRFRDQTSVGPYGDFVSQVDATVGDVLKALEDSGVADDTLVIYSSDNGSFMYRLDESDAPDHVGDETIQGYRPEHHRANYLFRGTKADIWEAGHHVPFFASWPGTDRSGLKGGGHDLPDGFVQHGF